VSTHAQAQVDVEAPFIAQDGLEYDDLAAFILGQPHDNWRNRTIQDFRRCGRSEAAIREWIAGYDGDDPTPTITRERQAREAQTSEEGVRITAALSRRYTPAYSRAYKVERHDDFCPF
jgi:hypothetical protein